MYLGKNTNVTKAAKESIRNYCLKNGYGRDDIADELGITKGTLDNKLKPSMPGNSFTVEEVLALCDLMDDDAILKAMCKERGLVVYDPIETMPDGGDIVHEMIVGVLDIDDATGNLAKQIKEAIEDGKIDETESASITDALKTLRSIERKLEVMLEREKKEQ